MDIQIPNREARELAYDDETDNYTVVQNDIVGTSRWSTEHTLVIKSKETGKFYTSYYRQGATEMQEESPFENDGEMITFHEVVPEEVTVIEYRRIV